MPIFDKLKTEPVNKLISGQEFRFFPITAAQRVNYGEYFDEYNTKFSNLSDSELEARQGEQVAAFRETYFSASLYLLVSTLKPGLPTSVSEDELKAEIKELPDRVFQQVLLEAEKANGLKDDEGKQPAD